MSVAKSRPAETAGGAAGLAGVVAGLLSGEWQVAVAALAGLLPAVVTFVVANGGLAGVWDLIIHGRRGFAALELLIALLVALVAYWILAIFLPSVVAAVIALIIVLVAISR